MHRPAPPHFIAIASLVGLLISIAAALPAQDPPSDGNPPHENSGAGVSKKSKQIVIHAENPQIRLAFSSHSSEVVDSFRRLIRERNYWVYPIHITVTGNPNDVISGRHTANQVEQLLDESYRLSLGVRLSAAFQWEFFDKELIRVLLYELMLRRFQNKPETTEGGSTLPKVPWLVEGTQQLLNYQKNGRPSDLYAGLLNSRQILSIREILSADLTTLDPVSRAVFTASATALISALLNQPGGHQSFRDFIGDLAGSGANDIEQLLRRHFPGFRGSPGAMEKWWSLEIASLGQQQAFEYFTAEQTESLLNEALIVRFGFEPKKDPKGIMKYLPQPQPAEPFEGRLHDFEEFEGRRDCKEALSHNRWQLSSLFVRCFPLYRDVIQRYQNAIGAIEKEKTRGLKDELQSIDEARVAVGRTVAQVEDYLNYYEATRSTGKSEAYQQYRKTREELQRQGPPKRKDRISTYLDAMEAEFGSSD